MFYINTHKLLFYIYMANTCRICLIHPGLFCECGFKHEFSQNVAVRINHSIEDIICIVSYVVQFQIFYIFYKILWKCEVIKN